MGDSESIRSSETTNPSLESYILSIKGMLIACKFRLILASGMDCSVKGKRSWKRCDGRCRRDERQVKYVFRPHSATSWAERRWLTASWPTQSCCRLFGLATARAPELAGYFQPGAGAFDGQLALPLGEAGHAVEEEPARRRAGVDGVGETLELVALLVQLADQIDQLIDRPAQPLELPHDQGVALAQHFEGLGQAGG